MAEEANTIEQLYYTWATSGFGHGPGYQVRAASEGLAEPNSLRYREIQGYLHYFLPSGTNTLEAAKDTATIDKAPVCLIFSTTRMERLLAYKVYRGRNENRDYGNYFVHLLAGLPADFVARDAIDLWRSSFWVTNEQNAEATRNLPRLSLSAFASSSSYFQEQILSETKDFMQKFLPQLIQVYLSAGKVQKIYIAGTSDHVALLIWGLTHCLPRTMQQDLTFSTYERERDILNAPVRIVGTCPPQTEILKGYIMPQLIPSEGYSKGLVIDTYTAKHSELSFVSDEIRTYALYATTCLVEGKKSELDRVLSSAEDAGVKDTDQLLSFLKLHTTSIGSELLTEREITALVTNKKSITKILRTPWAQQAIIGLALRDPAWWKKIALPAIQTLRSSFSIDDVQLRQDAALHSLGERIASELFGVMVQKKEKDVEVCGVNVPTKAEAIQALKQLLLDVAPTSAPPTGSGIKPWDNQPWVHLLDLFTEHRRKDQNFHPTLLDWNEQYKRSWFLQQWIFAYHIYDYEKRELQQHAARNKQEPDPQPKNVPINDRMILPWLQLQDWAEFLAILQLEYLPDRWCQLAFIQLLTYGKEPLPKELVYLFNKPDYYALFTGALVHMVEQGQGLEGVLRCFDGLAQRNFKGLVNILATLLGAGNLQPKMVDDLFVAAQLNSRAKVQLLEQYHQQLLPIESKAKPPKVVVEIIEEYISNLTLIKLSNSEVVATLTHLDAQQAKLPTVLAKKLHLWVVTSDIVNIPDRVPRVPLVSDYLMSLANAIQYFKLQNEKNYKEYLYFLLVANIKTRGDLVNVLTALSPVLGGPEDFFRELTAYIGKNNKQIPYERFVLYVEEALVRAATMKKDAEKERFLVPLLRDLFNNTRKLFDYIDAEVSPRWPDPMRANWELFAGKIPNRRIQTLADGMKAIGAVGGMAKDAVEIRKSAFEKGKERIYLPPKPPIDQPASVPPAKTPPNNHQSQSPSDESAGEILSYDADMFQAGSYNYNEVAEPSWEEKKLTITDPFPETLAIREQERRQPLTKSDPSKQQRRQPEPQSTVNGVPIYPDQIVRLYKLKDVYIRLRNDELDKASENANKNKLDTSWIIEEMEELGEFHTIEYALEALENDILISEALKHYSKQSASYGDASTDPVAFLNQVFGEAFSAVKRQREYRQVLGNSYSDKDMQDVLYVFLRYRTLAAFLRNQDQDSTMHSWLVKQRSLADTTPSFTPLPFVE